MANNQTLLEKIKNFASIGKDPTELQGATISGGANRTNSEKILYSAYTGRIPPEIDQNRYNNQTSPETIFTFAGIGEDQPNLVGVEYEIIIALHQSNMAGGQTTATGGSVVSPADDADPNLFQWSPNGGGTYGVGGADPNPADARTLKAASGGGLLWPQTIDLNRVGPAYSFAKAALAARPSQKFVIIPAGVGGTSINEWLPLSSTPSNWPANRYNVTKTAYDTFKAAFPNSRIYAFIASILENEIQNTLGAGNIAGWMDTYVDGYRAFGGTGASTAPFILSSPLWEWLGNTAVNRAYLLAAAKWAITKPYVGFIRRQLGNSVSGDTIHMTGVGNRIHGPVMYDHRAVTIAQTTSPASAPSCSLTGEQLNIVSVGAPYYEVWYRNPAGSGSYTKTEYVAKEDSKVGVTMKCIVPGGPGDRDAVVIAKAYGGDSASPPNSGTAPTVTFAVPAVTPPTPVVVLDVDNASLDGSNNIISIPSSGSDTTAWTPTAAAGQGATAALKRQLVGSKYGLILDSTSKSVWRGSSYVFPAGDISVVMPMLFTNAPGTGVFVGCGQSGTTMDMFFTCAGSGINVRGGFNNSNVQVLSSTNFLQFNTSADFYRCFAWIYNRTSNVLTVYMDDEVVLTGTPTQRAASPANSGGTRFYNSGLDTATAGWSGSTIALPPRVYNAALSFNEYQKIKNQYRVDHGVVFGYTPT